MGQQRRGRPTGSDDASTAMLSGSGPSQLGISGSMRARDVSRPSADDMAEAERIVQVSYRPRPRPPAARPNGSADQDSRGGSSPVRS